MPVGFERRVSKGITWWKPERKGDSIAGTVKKFHRSKLTNNVVPILDGGTDVGLIGLPDHAVLLDLLEGVQPGDEIIIYCVKKGSRKVGDIFDYEVGVKPAPEAEPE